MEIVNVKLSKISNIDIKMPKDDVIYPEVLKKGLWGKMELAGLERILDFSKPYDLIDIGANVGLISLYINHKMNIRNTICIEPNKTNFECLEYNTRNLNNCTLYNTGLGLENKYVKFYKDRRNHGNNSLFKNKELQDAGYTEELIELVDIRTFAPILKITNDIIYKSDTQGFDITLINNLSSSVWNRVNYAIIEVWNLNNEDLNKFIDKLSKFNIFIQGKNVISFDQLSENIKNIGNRQFNIICGIKKSF